MNEIQQMSATALTGAIRRREVSAREAVTTHLERIEEAIPTVTYPRVINRVGKSPPQYPDG
jgi:Asp-tRNA(Asn)/Glu-tRNA(Gln) amidotransferase A subunit family amidase